MLKPTYIIVLLLFLPLTLMSQKTYKVNVFSGYTFNNNIMLNDKIVNNSRGLIFAVSGLLELPLFRYIVLETGISGKAVLAAGSIGYSDYHSQTTRLIIPLLAGVRLNENLAFFAGTTIQNNPDLLDLHIRREYNLRYDLILKSYYNISDNWAIMKSFNYNIGAPDAYLINDPRTSLKAGISYKF